LVNCSSATIEAVSNAVGVVSLLIETVIREDAFNLYGFASENEKYWFNLLLNKVSGVGPKMAINVLSCVSPQELILAIAAKDKNIFKKGSGIGPKIAERIITELKDVVGKLPENIVSFSGNKTGKNNAATLPLQNISNDAISALENLGFARVDAYSIVNKLITENADITLQQIIKQGLKELSKIA
jgi:Holliday junction DNA helicase RuvA